MGKTIYSSPDSFFSNRHVSHRIARAFFSLSAHVSGGRLGQFRSKSNVLFEKKLGDKLIVFPSQCPSSKMTLKTLIILFVQFV